MEKEGCLSSPQSLRNEDFISTHASTICRAGRKGTNHTLALRLPKVVPVTVTLILLVKGNHMALSCAKEKDDCKEI